MFQCVDRYKKFPSIRVGKTFTMLDPMPRPLTGHHPFERPQRHGVFDVVAFCAGDDNNSYNPRSNAHLALIRWRATGRTQRLALWLIDMLPEVYH